MVEFVPKNLANGFASGTKATAYSVPVGSAAIVRSCILVNTHTAEVTVNLYANFGTGSRHISPKDLALSSGALYEMESSLTLEAEDIIEIAASVASVVEYVISGVEQV